MWDRSLESLQTVVYIHYPLRNGIRREIRMRAGARQTGRDRKVMKQRR